MRIRDPGWRQFGSGMRDPGWKKVGSGIMDKHPGSATLLNTEKAWIPFKLGSGTARLDGSDLNDSDP
jgi:hypothetical protein